MERIEKPKVLIPFSCCGNNEDCQDIFVYLRPESNGMLVESTLLGVIEREPVYKEHCRMTYLANFPGEFIRKKRIVENHYRLKLFFARKGKEAFTPKMRSVFEEHFNVPFAEAVLLNPFEAMRYLNLEEEELFNLWVEEKDLFYIHGQCIKRKGNIFILNADIPAILKKNTASTDIAVMIFRVNENFLEFHDILQKMEEALREKSILMPKDPASRVFHYSKGPFEQISDALGYLYDSQGKHISLKQISFCAYLIKRGISMIKIL